ncbi:hypothetical protein GQ42DRAFT_92321 [Ramicandelaber brevisporus]|nr:hypothetical protein GQ42DRAFT_92321 [Ramicandelaber brevisporus]
MRLIPVKLLVHLYACTLTLTTFATLLHDNVFIDLMLFLFGLLGQRICPFWGAVSPQRKSRMLIGRAIVEPTRSGTKLPITCCHMQCMFQNAVATFIDTLSACSPSSVDAIDRS